MAKSKREQELKEEAMEDGSEKVEKKDADKPKRKKMKKNLDSNAEEKKINETETNSGEKKMKRKKKKNEVENVENSEQTSENNESESTTEKTETGEPAKKKEISKRQQKRDKQLAREEAVKVEAHKVAVEKAMNYVSKWKHAKSDWKFEKMRQAWLINNLFDINSISDQMYPTVLEYFEDCKGLARELLKKKGQAVIQKIEDNPDDEEAVESDEYKRARLLLQSIPN